MSCPAPLSIIYCSKCGVPPEYCPFGPDFQSHCMPALIREHPALAQQLYGSQEATVPKSDSDDPAPTVSKTVSEETTSLEPWTPTERLTAFYNKYDPTKIPSIPTILTKYSGKEDALFTALTVKYGDEPLDPYLKVKYGIVEEDDEEVVSEGVSGLKLAQGLATKKVFAGKARGTSVKSVEKTCTRIVISKSKLQKKKWQTIVIGLETSPTIKLKEASQAFRKRFAGSSSVKDVAGRKEVIIQGDHVEECGRFIVEKFKVKKEEVWIDEDGEFVNVC
ncbi:hypothetical protein TrVE_jg2259 [Triparma verrucosa]|uniref:SUI1 domain-containing protein n=1 Tax=Triparma verrucosa TaxID=1606542 RepID=A0A9W7BNR8_9STRA|nr:hypothetical protein TrVE_jg2259 [Triparma verrucosa]